jgi:hypothetical protein
MTNDEADALILALRAGFPFPSVPEATVELWRTELERLPDFEAATEAVAGLVRSAKRWPPLVDFTDAYRASVHRKADVLARERGLDEPAIVPGREHALATLRAFDALPEWAAGPLTATMRRYFEQAARDKPTSADVPPGSDNSGGASTEGGER